MQFRTDVWGHPIAPNFNGQDILPLEEGTDSLSRKVGMDYHFSLRNSPHKHSAQHLVPKYLYSSLSRKLTNQLSSADYNRQYND
jgi:hypothetical protein